MEGATFLERLEEACTARRSLLCVGLDPDPALMPVDDVFEFNRAIIDATSDLVCAYKPNLAFYEALGLPGLEALEKTLRHIPPGIVTIGDAKRGDIGSTARAYARAMFEVWGFDAVTLNPYLGGDSLEPFLAYGDRGIFLLCRTSNPGATDFQSLVTLAEGPRRPLYQQVALKAKEWNRGRQVGLVVGATYPQELRGVRALCPEMPILIPGIGAQGGDLEAAVRWGTDGRGRLAIISATRQVIYASRGRDFPEAARRAASALRDEVNRILAGEGKGWS
jgi:orotidine-5'-phosphate decarboxylase